MDEQAPIHGACLCGGVRFEVGRVMGPLELCHCTRCRRVSGSAFFAGLRVASNGFRLLAGRDLIARFSLPVREHPPGFATAFCKRCGSPVPDPPVRGESFEIPVGLLDGDPGHVVDRHIFVEHEAAWMRGAHDCPRLDRAGVIAQRSAALKSEPTSG